MDEVLLNTEDPFQRERCEKIERYKQLNKYAKKGQIIFAGSSLAELFPINELLQNLSEKYIVYNRGICGDRIDDLSKDIEVCILDLCPSKLFINIGSNDISMEAYNENTLISKYVSILNLIKTKLPDIKIYLMSYYPVNPFKECFLLSTSIPLLMYIVSFWTIMET